MVWQENVNVFLHLQSDRRSGASNKRFLNLPIQFYLNKMSPKWDVTRLTRRVLLIDELRCICAALQTTSTDDRHRRPLLVCPTIYTMTLCRRAASNNVINLHQLTSHSTTSYPTIWRAYRDNILLWRYTGSRRYNYTRFPISQITIKRHSTLPRPSNYLICPSMPGAD